MNGESTDWAVKQLIAELRQNPTNHGGWTELFSHCDEWLTPMASITCEYCLGAQDVGNLLDEIRGSLQAAILETDEGVGAIRPYICSLATEVMFEWFKQTHGILVPTEELDKLEKKLVNVIDCVLVDEIIQNPENQRSWTTLINRHHDWLYQMAYCACNSNPTDAEDLVQEIEIEVSQAIPRYEGRDGATFKTYIGVIARRRISRWFQEQAKTPIPDEALDRIIDDRFAISGNEDEPAFDDVSEIAAQIRQNFASHYLEAIWFMFEKFSHKEIGYILEITEGTARARRYDAVEALRPLAMANEDSKKEFGNAAGRLEHLLEKIRRLFEAMGWMCGRHDIVAEKLCEQLREGIGRLYDMTKKAIGRAVRIELREAIAQLNDMEINKKHDETHTLVLELCTELCEANQRLYDIPVDELRRAIRRVYDAPTQ